MFVWFFNMLCIFIGSKSWAPKACHQGPQIRLNQTWYISLDFHIFPYMFLYFPGYVCVFFLICYVFSLGVSLGELCISKHSITSQSWRSLGAQKVHKQCAEIRFNQIWPEFGLVWFSCHQGPQIRLNQTWYISLDFHIFPYMFLYFPGYVCVVF